MRELSDEELLDYMMSSGGRKLLSPEEIERQTRSPEQQHRYVDMAHTAWLLMTWLRCALKDCLPCGRDDGKCIGDENLEIAREWLR